MKQMSTKMRTYIIILKCVECIAIFIYDPYCEYIHITHMLYIKNYV